MQLCGRSVSLVVILLAFPLSAQLTPQRDLSGNWIGSANLTSVWRDQRCIYRGSLSSVQLWLQQSGASASGGIKISIPPAGGGPDCRPLFKLYTISGVVSGTRFNFSDPAGNTWRLNFTSSLLGGRVDFTGDAPNPNEALAVGTSRPNGDTPLTRFSGTVTLRRQGPMDLERINRTRVPAPQELRMAFGEPTQIAPSTVRPSTIEPTPATASAPPERPPAPRPSSYQPRAPDPPKARGGPYYFQWTENPMAKAAKNAARTALGGAPDYSPPACKVFGPYESLEECNLASFRWAGAAAGVWIAIPCSTYRPFNCSSGGR